MRLNMYRSNEDLYNHIFDEIIFLESETGTMTKEAFLKDEKTQRHLHGVLKLLEKPLKTFQMI